jgi:phosphate acetyltransferase
MSAFEAILENAREAGKVVAFPEPEDARILPAARRLLDEQILTPVLVGNQDKVQAAAIKHGVVLDGLKQVDPATSPDRIATYVEMLAPRFATKGVSPEELAGMLLDPLWFAAAMVKNGEADGSLAGAAHTTGETLRAALKIIRPAEGARLVSSFFLMALQKPLPSGEAMLAFADCALVPDPAPDELADIAMRTAAGFRNLTGLVPRVALLSFSTAGSADHPAVRKVVEAREILATLQPDFEFGGELQLDAAILPEIGRAKAPDCPVAGRANVLIFPDLNSGNIGYKLVQRLAGAEVVGPILGGLAKPANDLSRGCSIDDVVLTAAATALQSMEN